MKLMVTFGREHITLGGERLHKCFLVVEIRGDQWAFCYLVEKQNMSYLVRIVRKWNLHEVSAQQAQIHGAEK